MPPRKRQVRAAPSLPSVVASSPDPAPQDEHASTSLTNINTRSCQPIPWLARLPPELLTEILSYLSVLPLTFYHDVSPTHNAYPPLNYRERTDVLRALSQTCVALRQVTLSLLWERLETAWVPEEKTGVWYKYVTMELERKANGILSRKDLIPHVRYLSFTLAKTKELDHAVAALASLLPALTNLHTLNIIGVKVPGSLKSALSSIKSLPSVHTAIVPTNAHALVRICTNVRHVRCVHGSGVELVGALQKVPSVKRFSGYVDWDETLIKRLVKCAPQLERLEIRRPVNNGLGIESQRYAPEGWADIIPHLSGLRKLELLDIVFPGTIEQPYDERIINAARKIVQESDAPADKKCLIIRRVQAPHYENDLKEEYEHSCVKEQF